MKTELDFQKAAEKIKHKKWITHYCSDCCYPCGFIFNENNTQILYDGGCHCAYEKYYAKKDWHDIVNFYNAQKHPAIIKEMNRFWGFNDEKPGENK